MRSRNRRVAALMMAVVMTVGSVMTASAAAGEGAGTYEGQDGKKPVISITLPTDAQLKGIYNYIADPNDLIGKTANARLGNVSISNNEGILFAVSSNKYANTSKMITVESKNYQDVDVTVEVKVKPDAKGDADIRYLPSKANISNGTNKNLYLAVVSADNIAEPEQTVSVSRSAVLTQVARGKKLNYTLSYNKTATPTTPVGYYYAVSQNAVGWDKVDFALTGAINKTATWGEGAKFPTLQVTWSYKEHREIDQSAFGGASTIAAASNSITVSESGAAISQVVLVKKGTTAELVVGNTLYTIAGQRVTVDAGLLRNNVGGKLIVRLNNGKEGHFTIQ